MIGIASLLIVVLLALLIERVAVVALLATGLSFEVARFQARSALTGVGYTTTESESLVNHPLRRRIILLLMMTGNAGFVTIIASLVFSFADSGSSRVVLLRLGILILGLIPIAFIARSKRFERRLTASIAKILSRFSELETRDMANLMQLTKDYGIGELQVQPGDWVEGKPLSSLHLPDEGVLVLGIQRADGSFIGAPRGGTVIHTYDMLVLYGRSAVLADLDARPADQRGDKAHEDKVFEQVHLMEEIEEDLG